METTQIQTSKYTLQYDLMYDTPDEQIKKLLQLAGGKGHILAVVTVSFNDPPNITNVGGLGGHAIEAEIVKVAKRFGGWQYDIYDDYMSGWDGYEYAINVELGFKTFEKYEEAARAIKAQWNKQVHRIQRMPVVDFSFKQHAEDFIQQYSAEYGTFKYVQYYDAADRVLKHLDLNPHESEIQSRKRIFIWARTEIPGIATPLESAWQNSLWDTSREFIEQVLEMKNGGWANNKMVCWTCGWDGPYKEFPFGYADGGPKGYWRMSRFFGFLCPKCKSKTATSLEIKDLRKEPQYMCNNHKCRGGRRKFVIPDLSSTRDAVKCPYCQKEELRRYAPGSNFGGPVINVEQITRSNSSGKTDVLILDREANLVKHLKNHM